MTDKQRERERREDWTTNRDKASVCLSHRMAANKPDRKHEAKMKNRLTLVHPVDVRRSGAFWRVAGQDDAFTLVSSLSLFVLF